MLWDWDGTLERVHHALYVATREREGREASPTAAIIDSQSAKAAQKGGSTLDPQGFDAAKKVTGRKRHILVDTLGLLLNVVVHSAVLKRVRTMGELSWRFPRDCDDQEDISIFASSYTDGCTGFGATRWCQSRSDRERLDDDTPIANANCRALTRPRVRSLTLFREEPGV